MLPIPVGDFISYFYSEYLDALITSNAPWNITQWIDPFDPHPKVTTMPLVLVVRKN